jgi:L-xylulokinase
MMCDALDLPLEIPEGSELGAKGAAICAGIACGTFTDYQDAVSKMVGIRERLSPRKEHAKVYAQKFLVYEKALAALDCFHN